MHFSFIARGRNVVMVVNFFDTINPTIAGDVLSEMYVYYASDHLVHTIT